jgi:hypothetical protein
MSDPQPFRQIDPNAVKSAAQRIADAKRKKIKEQLETRTHHHFDGGHDQTGSTLPKQVLQRQAAIEAFSNNPNGPPQLDVPLVAAALRAADVVQPELLENRTLAIAEMVISGASSHEIALALNLDPKLVRKELLTIHKLRELGMHKNPDLAEKLVQRELDVMEVTTDIIRTDMDLLSLLERELMLDHQDKLLALQNNSPYAWKKGMNALKVDAYFRARDSIGKGLDRMATLQGLMSKHLPSNQTNNTTTVVQFGNDALNTLANHFMQMSGNVPALIAEAQQTDNLAPPAEIVAIADYIDVQEP